MSRRVVGDGDFSVGDLAGRVRTELVELEGERLDQPFQVHRVGVHCVTFGDVVDQVVFSDRARMATVVCVPLAHFAGINVDSAPHANFVLELRNCFHWHRRLLEQEGFAHNVLVLDPDVGNQDFSGLLLGVRRSRKNGKGSKNQSHDGLNKFVHDLPPIKDRLVEWSRI